MPVADRAEVEEFILTAIRRELELDDSVSIELDADVRTLPNADSVRLLRVVGTVEHAYDVQFDDSVVFDVDSVRSLTDIVLALLGDDIAGSS